MAEGTFPLKKVVDPFDALSEKKVRTTVNPSSCERYSTSVSFGSDYDIPWETDGKLAARITSLLGVMLGSRRHVNHVPIFLSERYYPKTDDSSGRNMVPR